LTSDPARTGHGNRLPYQGRVAGRAGTEVVDGDRDGRVARVRDIVGEEQDGGPMTFCWTGSTAGFEEIARNGPMPE
jgi:hypothetical protein